MTISVPTQAFREAKWIVSPTAGQGTHTTIAAAITAASSGDTIFIRPGTYTENLTLKAGVDLTAWPGDESDGNVTIVGKATLTVATTINISSIRLQTNSDFCLVVSGSAASNINLNKCYINATNNTALSITSSGSPNIVLDDCTGDLGTTGIAYMAVSATGGIVRIIECTLFNSANSTTANTNSGNMTISINNSQIASPFSTSGTTALLQIANSAIDCQSINTTAITINSTSATAQNITNSYVASGTASAISVGAAAGSGLVVSGCTINSTNTNAITGSGTINYAGLVFSGSSSTINTTTRQPLSVSGAGTSGQAWISNGTGSSPTFGTLGVAGGGTGDTSLTAYAVLCGGTSSTGAIQSIASVGTAGQVLTSAGASALPTFSTNTFIQQVRTSSTSTDSTASHYAANTVPTTSNGKQLFSLAITPKSASNILVVESTVTGTASSTACIALFQDAGTNAVAVTASGQGSENFMNWNLRFSVTSGGTSAITFVLRYGATANTMYVNQDSGGNTFGGFLTSYMQVTEYSA